MGKTDAPIALSVCAPAYNEEAGIAQVVEQWDQLLGNAGISYEIVITNDGSTDRTGEVLAELQKRLTTLVIMNNPTNAGYGKALSDAIAASRGECLITIDSDGQFDLADGLKLFQHLQANGYDVVAGYRVQKKDKLLRVVGDRVLNRIIRLGFGVAYRDTNCALRAMRGELLRKISIEGRGYPVPSEILLKLHALGARIVEIPVRHYERETGVSKLKPFRTGMQMLRFLRMLRLKLQLYRTGIVSHL